MKSEKDNRLKIHHLCKFTIAVLPFVACVAMEAHCVLLLLGIHLNWSELAFSHSLFDTIMWLVTSCAFRFCWVHRALILFCYLTSVCIDYERMVGFGRWLTPMRIAVVSIGAVLLWKFFRLQVYNVKNT